MFTAYAVVSVLLAAYLAFSAAADFVRYRRVLVAMARASVPDSWLPLLGTLKAAGALGLLVGLGVPLLGTAAAVGVVLFFVGAFVVHLRAHFYSFGFAGSFLALAVAALALALANLDVWGRNCELVLRGCSG
jgi:DoxX-like family